MVSAHGGTMSEHRGVKILCNVGVYAWKEYMSVVEKCDMYSWDNIGIGIRGTILATFHNDCNKDASKRGRMLVKKLLKLKSTMKRFELCEMREDVH